MSKEKKVKTVYDELNEAIEAGNLTKAFEIYEQHIVAVGPSPFASGSHRFVSNQVRQAVIEACLKDPVDVARQLFTRMLGIQAMLMFRVERKIASDINIHDGIMQEQHWGDLPDRVADELLPRLCRLQTEVKSTVKLILELDKKSVAGDSPKSNIHEVIRDGEKAA